MAWWITALIYIGLTLVYELIRPKPKFDSPDPSSIGDFQFPPVGEGRPGGCGGVALGGGGRGLGAAEQIQGGFGAQVAAGGGLL